MRPTTQADIERLYAQPTTEPLDLSTEAIEFHIMRGRALRSQVAAGFLRQAGAALWRLVTFSPRRVSGRLTPSNV